MLIIYIIIQKISTTGKSPNMIFKSKDELIFKKVKEKTTKILKKIIQLLKMNLDF